MNPPPPLTTPEDLHGPPAVESPRQVPRRLFSSREKIAYDSQGQQRFQFEPTQHHQIELAIEVTTRRQMRRPKITKAPLKKPRENRASRCGTHLTSCFIQVPATITSSSLRLLVAAFPAGPACGEYPTRRGLRR